MFPRLLLASFRRSPRRHLLALAALTLGTAVVTALGGTAVGVGDRMSRELRTTGANLRVTPQTDRLPLEIHGVDYRALAEGGFIPEADLPGIKDHFWANQIVAFAPVLPVPVRLDGERTVLVGTWFDRPISLPTGGSARASLPAVQPSWSVIGRWPRDDAEEVVLGARLAERLGRAEDGTVTVRCGDRTAVLRVVGRLHTGGAEEEQAFVPLPRAQTLAGCPGSVKEVWVSALVTPDSRLVEKLGRDPTSLSPEEYDRWYCTPYASSIARRIEERLPGVVVTPVRRATETEGRLLRRVSGLLLAAALAALVAASLGMFSAAATSLLERRHEIGLLQALGAEPWQIAAVYLGEAALLGTLGTLFGAGLGWALGDAISRAVFGQPMPLAPGTVLLALAAGLGMALLGAAWPVRRALAVDPVRALRDP